MLEDWSITALDDMPSVSIFRRTLLGYYVERMHTNFKEDDLACTVVWRRYQWFLLNNKIVTFHDLFTFTESIDKQQPLFNLLQLLYCDSTPRQGRLRRALVPNRRLCFVLFEYGRFR